MGLNLFMLVMAMFLIGAVVAVNTGRPVSVGSNRPAQPQEASAVETVNDDRTFFIEHVPEKMRVVGNELVAAASVQADFLAAGDVLLRKLPTDICDCLGGPISSDLTAQLSQGDNLADLTPKRVRAAISVATAALALNMLMFDVDTTVKQPPYRVELDKRGDFLTAGPNNFRAAYVTSRIRRRIGVSAEVAAEMWRWIVEILREDFVRVPGIRPVKR